MIDKRALLDALVAQLEAEAAALVAAADATYRGATHEEAKPENDKDTRALEASYLARGQAMRVEEMQEAITRLRFESLRRYTEEDAIGPLAVVEVLIDGERPEHFFLVPLGGGRTVTLRDAPRVRVVTTTSPVGRALLGKMVGDDFSLQIAGRLREYVIEAVA